MTSVIETIKEKKTYIGLAALILISVNTIIDSGVFFLPGVAMGIAGPASLIAWGVLILIFLYIAGCFAELVSMFPKAGGIYEYSKQTYGKVPSFVIGWLGWLIANVSMAVLITGANLSIHVGGEFTTNLVRLLVAIFVILILNYVAYRGLNIGVKVIIFFALVGIATILLLIVSLFFNFNPTFLQPFFLFDNITTNISSLFVAIFFISELFFGIEGITYLAEEVDEPKKVLPKAIIIGELIVIILVMGLLFLSFGYTNWAVFASQESPYSYIMQNIYGITGNFFFNILVYLVIVGTLVSLVIETPFLLMAMSRDKLFLPHFAERHKKYNSPHKAVIFQLFITLLFVIIGFTIGGFKTLVSIIVPLSIILYIFIILSIPILRWKRKDIYRSFKVPLGKIIPFIIIALFLSFLVFWLKNESGAFSILLLSIAITLLGLPFYLLISFYYNPKMITNVHDIIANIELSLEKFLLPKNERLEILKLLGDIKGKSILEFGSGVGTMTLVLAEEIGEEGLLYSTSFVKNDFKIVERRVKENNLKNVKVLFDEYHAKRVHPDVPYVESCVSIGLISYLQDIERVLQEINSRLTMNGRIVVMDYEKFYKLIPNVPWLSDNKKIEDIFGVNGFRINVKRKKGFLWNYIFIYGEKIKDISPFYYVSEKIRK